MKKTKLFHYILAIFLLPLNLMVVVTSCVQPQGQQVEYKAPEPPKEEWTEIGQITGDSFSYDLAEAVFNKNKREYKSGSKSGTLYVKTVGGNAIYKIVIQNNYGSYEKKDYSVGRTNERPGYNAKFTYGNTTYFISI